MTRSMAFAVDRWIDCVRWLSDPTPLNWSLLRVGVFCKKDSRSTGGRHLTQEVIVAAVPKRVLYSVEVEQYLSRCKHTALARAERLANKSKQLCRLKCGRDFRDYPDRYALKRAQIGRAHV